MASGVPYEMYAKERDDAKHYRALAERLAAALADVETYCNDPKVVAQASAALLEAREAGLLPEAAVREE